MRTRTPTRILSLLLAITAFAQTADLSGWPYSSAAELRWGTTKPTALKTLRPFGVHECDPATKACAEAAGVETLVLNQYNLNNVLFRVNLLFNKDGFIKTVMTAEDKRDAFEKTLSTLTNRYGKPGLQSAYDGDQEQTFTTWIWPKPHGKVSLTSDEAAGTFTVTYQAAR